MSVPAALMAQTSAPNPPAPDGGVQVSPDVVFRTADGQTTVRAVKLAGPLKVDGQLDEAVYSEVLAISDFIQQEPDAGAPSTERTDAWVFFDGGNLYVAGRCWDDHPERMLGSEMRRDGDFTGSGEWFAVALDTFHDRRSGYAFYFSMLGGFWDGLITNETEYNRDWNGVLDVRTQRFEKGWQFEMVIPFKTLRYPAGVKQTWGLSLGRGIRWKNEVAFLTRIPPTGSVFRMSLAATLIGLEVPPSSKSLDIKPYVLGGVTTDRTVQRPTSNSLNGHGGFDVKYGVTKSFTGDFTYNTDFAQVEADLQQVNLTRFSLFYPEKREFFLEGAGIFSFGSTAGVGSSAGTDVPVMFFSRQIGLHNGHTVPIVGGGRLTGKSGPFTIGLVSIQTNDDSALGVPTTNFSVVRLKHDMLRRSSIGVLLTRRSESTVVTGSNEVYGIDGKFAFFDNLSLTTYFARTRTPTRSGDDISYRVDMNYDGDRYGLEIDRLHVGRNFNPEIGFVRRLEFDKTFVNARFSPRPKSTLVRKYFYEVSYTRYPNSTTGRMESRDAQATFRTQFQNSDQFNITVGHAYEYLKVPFAIARGVTIPAGAYGFTQVFMTHTLGRQRRLSGALGYTAGQFYDGHQQTFSYTSSRVKITPQFYLEPNVTINRIELKGASFTARLLGARATYTFTPRTFLAALAQYNSNTSSVSTNVRLRWEYTPGSEFFVVYSDGYDSLHNLALQNRGLVIKVNRLIRF